MAEQGPERLRHLVYRDALVPQDGQSFLDMAGPEVGPRILADIAARGDDWRMPVDRAANPRLTDHPFKTMTGRVHLGNPMAAALPRTYILALDKPPGTMHTRLTQEAADRGRAAGWAVHELPTGHDAEQTLPDAVTALLLALA